MRSEVAPIHKRVTLAEVAKASKVSLATASAVLNGKSSVVRISDETRNRVMAAAETLDYTPNLLVRGIQSGRTGVISFFNAFRTRTIGDLYMDRLSATLEVAAGELGYDLLMHCNFRRTAAETYRFLNGGQADGVLVFAPIEDDPLLPYLRTSTLPTVLVNSSDPEGILASVRDDVRGAMDALAEQLVQLGHRRIQPVLEDAIVGTDAFDRIRFLRLALADRGLELMSEFVAISDPDALAPQLKAIAARPDAPTAFFCWRDYLAYRFIEAAEIAGIDVPGDISVVGYDGLHWPGSSPHIAASIHIDLQQLAQRSVQMIDAIIRHQPQTERQALVDAEIVQGTTLGPPPLPRPSA